MAVTYFHRIPFFVPWLFPKAQWKGSDDAIYLTFDDGPSESNTLKIATLLNEKKAPATFFFLGERAQQFPHIVKAVEALGHRVGFHANQHLNLKKLSSQAFEANTTPPTEIAHCNLFRAPYGKLTRKQLKQLSLRYHVIQWSLMPGDFDASLSFEKKLRQLMRAKPGDIVVLHDSEETLALLQKFFEGTKHTKFKSV